MAPGNPLRGYIPNGTQLSETSDGVSVKEPGRAEPVLYKTWAGMRQVPEEQRGRLVDVFVTGEVRTRRCGSMRGRSLTSPHLSSPHRTRSRHRIGTFGVGPVQPRGPYQAVRRVHQPVEGIRTSRVAMCSSVV